MNFPTIFLLIIFQLFYSVSCGIPEQYFVGQIAREYKDNSDVQLYQPFNLYHTSTSSTKPQSKNFKQIKAPSPIHNVNEINKLLHLKPKIQSNNHLSMCLNNLASKLETLSRSVTSSGSLSPSVFTKGGQFQKTINVSVHILEKYDLKPKERIWVLAVLRHLQGYLPNGDLPQLKLDMHWGPIRRAAVQLHLTRGLDLLRASQKIYKASGNIEPALEEALEKLTIIDWIKAKSKEHWADKNV
ncbi:hypothetical protein DFH28DRAFT_633279 [Melampsora americana]|nr:hypothetical protein DFH28DRAFT_633279 [Melampsora americana]